MQEQKNKSLLLTALFGVGKAALAWFVAYLIVCLINNSERGEK